MNERDYIQLTLFQGDSLASPLVWLESKKEKGTTVTYGRRCSELSENLRRVGLSVRTYLESCKLPGKQFVRTWSVKDTLSPYLIMKLRLSVQNTDETGCSLWATPNTMDSLPSRSYEAMKRQATNGGRKNRRRPGNLREQVDPLMCQAYEEARAEANGMMWQTPSVEDASRTGSAEAWMEYQEHGRTTQCRLRNQAAMWPTPTVADTYTGNMKSTQQKPGSMHSVNLVDAVKMWPTPTRREHKGARTPEALKAAGRTPNNTLGDAVMATDGGQLNPTWVEWLMGFPIGWTDLSV